MTMHVEEDLRDTRIMQVVQKGKPVSLDTTGSPAW